MAELHIYMSIFVRNALEKVPKHKTPVPAMDSKRTGERKKQAVVSPTTIGQFDICTRLCHYWITRGYLYICYICSEAGCTCKCLSILCGVYWDDRRSVTMVTTFITFLVSLSSIVLFSVYKLVYSALLLLRNVAHCHWFAHNFQQVFCSECLVTCKKGLNDPNTTHIGACAFTLYKRRGAPLPDNKPMRLYSRSIRFCDDYTLLS